MLCYEDVEEEVIHEACVCSDLLRMLSPQVDHSSFPGGTSREEPAYQCRRHKRRDSSSILGSGLSPGGGHGNLLQYSCLENPMDRGTWRVAVHRVVQSRIRLKWLSRHADNSDPMILLKAGLLALTLNLSLSSCFIFSTLWILIYMSLLHIIGNFSSGHSLSALVMIKMFTMFIQ